MNTKHYLALSGSIFFAIGLLHLLRLLYHWPAEVGGWLVPQGLSYVGLPIGWGLSLWAYRLGRRF